MIEKKCECGCNIFNINNRSLIIECALCKQKYSLNKNKWIKINKKKKEIIIPKKENIKESLQNKIETIGEFRKRLGIQKINKRVRKQKATAEEIKIINEYNKQKQLEIKQLKKLWHNELHFLKNNYIISFNKNEHKGKLRGKHIAIMFHRDLKKIGIKNKLYFRKDNAFVEMI